MNVAIILCDEYAVVVGARLGSNHNAGFSVLPVNLIIAAGKWIVVFGEPYGETVNAAMPNHLGIWLDGQRLHEPVCTLTTDLNNFYINLRICLNLLWGSHIQPFLIVVDVRGLLNDVG